MKIINKTDEPDLVSIGVLLDGAVFRSPKNGIRDGVQMKIWTKPDDKRSGKIRSVSLISGMTYLHPHDYGVIHMIAELHVKEDS